MKLCFLHAFQMHDLSPSAQAHIDGVPFQHKPRHMNFSFRRSFNHWGGACLPQDLKRVCCKREAPQPLPSLRA